MNNAKDYYNKHSYDYVKKWELFGDNSGNPSHYYRRHLMNNVLQISNIKRHDNVIEIGCGSGLVLKELLENTNKVFGTDISHEMLKRVKDSTIIDNQVIIVDNFLNLDQYSGSEVLLMVDSFLKLKLPKNYFDKILSVEVLRYIDNIDVCFNNLKQIMKDDSLFIFTVTNFWSFSFFPLKFYLRKMFRLVKKNELLQFFVTERSINKKLEKAGFDIVDFRRCGFLTANSIFRRFIKNLSIFDKMIYIDNALSKLPIFKYFFDTFIIVVKRNGD